MEISEDGLVVSKEKVQGKTSMTGLRRENRSAGYGRHQLEGQADGPVRPYNLQPHLGENSNDVWLVNLL